MRLRILLCALAMLNAGAAVAVAGEPHLGTPEVITSFSGESDIIASSSLPGHGDVYAVFHRIIGKNLYTVVYRDEHGHAHKFDIPTTNSSFPMAIRFAGLEDGGGMVLWDDGANHRILARSWLRDGTLAATQTVLAQVTTENNIGFGGPQWQMSADGAGTVVVATTGPVPDDAGRVIATVRDPGGQFGAPQELTPANEPAIIDRRILVSPIARDGTVAISWGPGEDVAGPGGRAIRSGRSPRFDAPAVVPFAVPLGLTKTNRSILGPDAAPITIDAGVAHFCPCTNARVFTWTGDVRVLAFQTDGGDWYVARGGRDGAFTGAVKATEHAAAVPMRRARPGEVGFASFDTETDNLLFRQHSRLIVIPFGSKVPASRRAPRLRFGTYATVVNHHLLVPVYCDRVCGIHGSSGGDTRLRIVDYRARRVDPRLEPFTVRYLRVAFPAPHVNARVSASASDDAGHRATARATFVRGKRAVFWCLSTKPGC
jgi:hypothetical protein